MKHTLWTLLLVPLLSGTLGIASCDTTVDADADGYPATEDCNDNDASIHPGAPDGCDGVDNDCDGSDGPLTTWYVDGDGDGWGSTPITGSACTPEATWVATADDCDDSNSNVYPGANEQCDGIDNDCDQLVDDADADVSNATVIYVDADGDGYGNPASTVLACQLSPGYSAQGYDCNDANPAVNPAASESVGDNIDQNCDGLEMCYSDSDNDGSATSTLRSSSDSDCNDSGEGTVSELSSPAGPDCNDANAKVSPLAGEVIGDGIDQNCDGRETCYVDADGDGSAISSTLISSDTDCLDPGEGTSTEYASPKGPDCNDANTSIYPGASEVVGDGIDQNCDGKESCYTDVDNDGSAVNTVRTSSDLDCYDAGEGTAAELASPKGPDCNDYDSAIHPGAGETAGSGGDEDCDGKVLCYTDLDNDGYRPYTWNTVISTDLDCYDSGEATSSQPDTDCNDADANINPGAPEVPGNTVDENCNGTTAEKLTSMDGGDRHALAVDAKGRVWGWGYNYYGQVGDGTTTSRTAPVLASFSSGTVLKSVAGGYGHSLAIDTAGKVWSWGQNADGQLGDGTTTNHSKPALTVGLSSVTVAAVAAGENHSLALDTAGRVWAWGDNVYGGLGDGTTTDRSSPVQVKGLSGVIVKAIAAGDRFSVAVDSSGYVWTWGYNSYGQLGNGTTVNSSTPVQVKGISGFPTTIAAANNWAAATSNNGQVYLWGDGKSTASGVIHPGGLSFVKVALGAETVYALDSSSIVWAWGSNADGEIGDGTTLSRTSPTQISALRGKGITQIVAGQEFALALSSGGILYSWGANEKGQAGIEVSSVVTSAVELATWGDVREVSAGQYHSLAVATNDELLAWGEDDYAQLSNGNEASNEAQFVVGLEGLVVKTSAGGNDHSMMVDSGGTAWSWGRNNYGQLGDGSTTDKTAPVMVKGLSGVFIADVAAGSNHSLALDDLGRVWAWGYNTNGELGDGTTTARSTPGQVHFPSGTVIVQVVSGDSHSLALDATGKLWAWGSNVDGKLGDGTTTNRTTPVLVTGLTGVTVKWLDAGSTHSLVVDSKNQVLSWGGNAYGQLGDSGGSRSVPGLVGGLNGLQLEGVCAGAYHSVVLDSNGGAWAWGHNAAGQLGDGTTSSHSTPSQVLGLTGTSLEAISCGYYHTLALTNLQTAMAWGSNGKGQIGMGVDTLTPGLVHFP